MTTSQASQDDLSENLELQSLSSLNTPLKKFKKNKISIPPQQSPSRHRNNDDLIEIFTIKQRKTSTSENSITSDDLVSGRTRKTEKSYSEKINERFKTIKEKAKTSTQKAKFKNVTTKVIFNKLKRESQNVETELKTIKNRFKLGQNTSEKYNFFTSDQPSASLVNGDEVEYVFPEKVDLKTAEEELFLKPGKKIIENSLGETTGRNFEDEGLFVSPKPNLSKSQLRLLKQRLFEDGKNWFDCNGELKIVQNPVNKSSKRPHLKALPSTEITTYLAPSEKNQDLEEIVVIGDNILEVKIGEFNFLHHPLFSTEHVFAKKLQSSYETYTEIHNSNIIKILDDKLETLRHMKRKLENSLKGSGDFEKEERKINNYNKEIQELQELLFKEGKRLRDTFKSILETWKIIKKIREHNKYATTPIKLTIVTEKVNYDEECTIFEQKIEEIVREKLNEWKIKNANKQSSESNEEEDNSQSDTDHEEEKIRKTIRKRFQESFKAPGEPIIYFTLTQDNEVTTDIENEQEKQRRQAVAATKVFLKILCNNIEVCKSKTLNLTDSFVCNFNEIFSIQLVKVPKALSVEIFEQNNNLLKRKIGTLSIKIPSKIGDYKMRRESFEKPDIIHYKHQGVGSGVRLGELLKTFNINKYEDAELFTSGFLSISINWDKKIKNNDKDFHYNKQIDEIVDKQGLINKEKLFDWLENNKPDPQDPQNIIFYEYTMNDKEKFQKDFDYFRLNYHLNEYKFCELNEIDDNLRLKLLKLRDQNEPEFDGMIIPNRVKEIPKNILSDYKKRIQEERQLQTDNEADEEEEQEKENLEYRGRKKLKQIQIKIFQKCKNTENNLTYEDVVDEKKLINWELFIKSFFETIVNWFRWTPKIVKSFTFISEKDTTSHTIREVFVSPKVKIFVNSATNIPKKVDDSNSKVFVQAIYNNESSRTLTVEGCNPIWDQELVLPLEVSHTDYLNPNSLNGSIMVVVYDETDEIPMHLLGFIEISLSAICQNTTMEGVFELKTPSLLFGYDDINKVLKPPKPSHIQLPQNKEIYLNLKINTEPNIPKLGPSIEELPCSELPYIKDHIITWNRDYNSRYPNRKFSAFVIDSNGTINCLVRYIKPLEPPQINVEGFDVTPEQCLRYVSLIPFTNCNKFYQNICLTTQQFLRYMIGSILDHAIALTCYLMALKLDVYLLLGYGIPHGFSAYVLEKLTERNLPKYYVYDVVYGKKYVVGESFCTLQRVYAAVTDTNIWANLQRTNDIKLTRFDFTRKSDWWPLFTNSITAPTTSIQSSITYKEKADLGQLEVKLERKLKKEFSKQRRLDRTIWNHTISEVFKDFIQSMEANLMYGKNISDAYVKLHGALTSYKVKGHCQNLPFADVKQVISFVKLLGVHLVNDCENFALAVHLDSYPNDVITIWIMVASLLKENEMS